ncbi:hypothetical protein [Pokkaliibacter plantistimulans]|uniref:hypothetical protein n=1 Tax=Pokkaliibacter plantistimulans TaxID=1635171 RepID=UPI000CE2EA24|nr:hypothetical protein [Pokkaliibacter plantistimulans]
MKGTAYQDHKFKDTSSEIKKDITPTVSSKSNLPQQPLSTEDRYLIELNKLSEDFKMELKDYIDQHKYENE